MVAQELRFPIAPQAVPISAGLAGFALLALLLGWGWVAALGLGLALANAAFFRNPGRAIPADQHLVVSPGDGRVVEVVRLAEPDSFVGPAWRIAIFLSIFDVHINRVPVSGKVRAIRRRGGRFLAAFRAGASGRNVQSRMDIEGPEGTRLSVVQIAGLVARRIVCYASEGGTLERGEPYGLLCYGSRMEVYMPVEAEICVGPGDRVRGGETVIAEIRS